ncbi:UbiD family decarboxylase [Haloferax sp. DFSO52]|uniref:UbiD family decarboxylase n=1 Tax=Haloferax sp. DFSO52 TaxID=3388505 RepID=UPI003A8770A9
MSSHDTDSPQYPDMREHLDQLREKDLLVEVDREINKDTEMHPLVRWQFRGGLPEEERKAFLFTNVTDSLGNSFETPVAVGALAANPAIYGTGLGVDPSGVNKKWNDALDNPIEPVEVSSSDAPAHEVVYSGSDLDEEGQALDGIPIPISTPGFDNAPYTSMSAFVTHHPETGNRNIGIYRAQVKGRKRTGMNPSIEWGKGAYEHWKVAKERGEPLPAALVVSAPPAVAYTSAQSLNFGVDELAVSGGLVGEPMREVEAKTVPVMVPADADIVIEGEISTDVLEPEAPFGESHGFINNKEYNMVMDVTAVTKRRDAIHTSIISQVTPSESSVIKKVALEPLFYKHLTEQCKLNCVADVKLHEPLTNLRKLIIVQIKSGTKRSAVWRALTACASFRASHGKFVVAVDEDIDPDNLDAVFWAMGYRSTPHEDTQIIEGRSVGHAPRHEGQDESSDSAILWDATLKRKLPPISLPKKEYMEHAREIWNELELPELSPEMPWYGYSLGEWNDQLVEEAERAVEGRYYETGEELKDRQVSTDDVEPNTPVFSDEDFK